MSLSVATNVNIDTLKNLDSSKTYFLSSTTGQVKEASFWMRFKCAIGVQSARQKVANLVDAVRTPLLDAADQTDNANLTTDIKTIDRRFMVKGSAIKDIADRFSVVNANTIAKASAAKIAASSAEKFATNFSVIKFNEGVVQFNVGDGKAIASIFNHAFKEVVDGQLPMKKDLYGRSVLDRLNFANSLNKTALKVKNLILEIVRSNNLTDGVIDRHYAKHIVDTLFNKDGTRNEKTIADLKSPMQVKADAATTTT